MCGFLEFSFEFLTGITGKPVKIFKFWSLNISLSFGGINTLALSSSVKEPFKKKAWRQNVGQPFDFNCQFNCLSEHFTTKKG